MSKFTPWKWKFTIEDGEIVSNGRKIADVYDGNPNYLANARLIAAAPEMYALLNDIVMAHSDGYQEMIAELLKRASDCLTRIDGVQEAKS